MALGALLLLGAAACGVIAFVVYDNVLLPGKPGETVNVTIPVGATGRDVGRILQQAALLDHEAYFRLALKYDGANKPIRSGIYELPRGLSALELLHRLYEGPTRPLEDNKVTIAEGLSLAQAAAEFPHPDAFVEAASDPALIARLGLQTKTLEGFLMPSTYFFAKPPTERQVAERMVDQFEKVWAKLVQTFPDAAQRDRLEVVTVASLVEKEAKVPEERPKVAAVIYNRLKQNMPLQLDSTLQYALNKYGQRMLDVDKEVDSPYNTYKHPGLPPGPISSPGLDSMRAALQPAQEEYLYFVSNADAKTHTFSKSMDEHLKAVARYRREIAKQRQEQQNKPQP
jgi:UPF0755 protein